MGKGNRSIAPTIFLVMEISKYMPLFDRKSQRLSYSLSKTAKLWILVITSLFLMGTFIGWFFQGAMFVPARERMNRDFPWNLLYLGFAVGGATLTGVRITDRTEDRDR